MSPDELDPTGAVVNMIEVLFSPLEFNEFEIGFKPGINDVLEDSLVKVTNFGFIVESLLSLFDVVNRLFVKYGFEDDVCRLVVLDTGCSVFSSTFFVCFSFWISLRYFS